jgi:hypothetical protein
MTIFSKQVIERAVKTFAQVFLATYLAGIGSVTGLSGFFDASVADKAAVAGIGALLSVVMSFLSRPLGDNDSPSAV